MSLTSPYLARNRPTAGDGDKDPASPPPRLSSPFIDPDSEVAGGEPHQNDHAASGPTRVADIHAEFRLPSSPTAPHYEPNPVMAASPRRRPPPSPVLGPLLSADASMVSSLAASIDLGNASGSSASARKGLSSSASDAVRSPALASPPQTPADEARAASTSHNTSEDDGRDRLAAPFLFARGRDTAQLDGDAATFADPCLLQMLSMMGSKIVEAEEQGFLQYGELGRDDDADMATSEADAAPPLSASMRVQRDNVHTQRQEPPRSMSTSLLGPAARPQVARAWGGIGSQSAGSTSSHTVDRPIFAPILSDAMIGDKEERDLAHEAMSTCSDSDPSASDGALQHSVASIHSLSTPAPMEASKTAGALDADRHAQLADRLRAMFSLDGTEELESCHPCWLFRGSILLHGFLYLTTGHVLFYAYLPSKEDDRVVRAGSLRKRTRRTHRFSQHWAVLRGRALTWYESERDPYFPQAHIDLREVGSVRRVDDDEAWGERGAFVVETPHRSFVFAAPGSDGADAWVEALQKACFRAQNEGESVRVSIPLENILDVDGSTAVDDDDDNAGLRGQAGSARPGIDLGDVPPPTSMATALEGMVESSDVVCIKVLDGASEDFAVDEYFFAHVSAHTSLIERLRASVAQQAVHDAAAAAAAAAVAVTNVGLTSTGAGAGAGTGLRDSAASLRTIRLPASAGSPTPSEPRRQSSLRRMISTRGSAQTASRPAGLSANATSRAVAAAGEDFDDATPPVGSLAASRASAGGSEVEAGGMGYPPVSLADLRALDQATTSSGVEDRPAGGATTGAGASWRESVPTWLKEAGEKILASTQGTPTAAATTAADVVAALARGSFRRAPRRAVRETWSWWPAPAQAPLSLEEACLGDDAFAGPPQNMAEGEEGIEGDGLNPTAKALEELRLQPLSSSIARLESASTAGTRVYSRREQELRAQFRQCFALAPDEELLGHFSSSLFRVLPVAGRIFISTKHMCFRSSRLVSKTMGRTLMMLPLSEIVSAAKHRAFRFQQHGMVVIVKGHEELFFEFPSLEERASCIALLEKRLDRLEEQRRRRAEETGADVSPDTRHSSDERAEAVMLTDLGHRLDPTLADQKQDTSTQSAVSSALSHASGAADHLPQHPSDPMFRSNTSSFLSFKPPKPLRFTILTIGSRGDVQPYIALARSLLAEGHSVRIATHGEFQGWIEGHGIEFREVGGDPAELMRICVENGTFTLSFLREGLTRFRGWLDDLLISAWQACQGTEVLLECPSAIAGIHVAEALQVPYFRAFTMPWSRTRAYPHAFAVPSSKAGGNYNYMSYVIFDQVFWRASAGQINRWRTKVLGLQPTNFVRLEQHRVPFLYNFSSSLVPKPIDWYEWIHVTGFWFLDDPDGTRSKAWEPPADLVRFIADARERGRKLVYIGWGSIVVSDAAAVTRCVVEAVEKSGVCAILSRGWSDRVTASAGGPGGSPSAPTQSLLPHPDIFQVDSVPHDWLFPQLDAACHHGGAGTLGASVRAGIPTIVKPYFGDQWFWGQQVESLGVGSCVRKLTSDSLAEALRTATHDERQREQARRLGERVRAEDGVAAAVKAIYRDLDYARSLIKRGTRLGQEFGVGEASEPGRGGGGQADGASFASSRKGGGAGPIGAHGSSDDVVAGVDVAKTTAAAAATAPAIRARASSTSSLQSVHSSSAGAGARDEGLEDDGWSVVSGSQEDEDAGGLTSAAATS